MASDLMVSDVFGAGSAEGPLELGGSKKILDLGSRAVSRNSGNIYKL